MEVGQRGFELLDTVHLTIRQKLYIFLRSKGYFMKQQISAAEGGKETESKNFYNNIVLTTIFVAQYIL